jgi:hypothetical protein
MGELLTLQSLPAVRPGAYDRSAFFLDRPSAIAAERTG